jgi:hypothetical protein
MTREIYNKFNSLDIVRVIEVGKLECCENGWSKESKEVTRRQSRRREKK